MLDDKPEVPPWNGVPRQDTVAHALSLWSEIESADIRWELVRQEEGRGMALDGVNTIWVAGPTETGELLGSHVRWWFDETTNEIVECDIYWREEDELWSIAHEFGHCLGLLHGPSHSRYAAASADIPSARGETPIMSYGLGVLSTPVGLTLDDVVGASLLRPAHGWVGGTGTISGQVTVGGSPGVFVSVYADALSGGSLGSAVGVWTDEEGRFLIEGLAPGNYLVWAKPMVAVNCAPGLARTAVLDALDGGRLDVVSVRAGADTGGIVLDLLPGRGRVAELVR